MNIKEFKEAYTEFLVSNLISPKAVHCSHGGSMLLLGLKESTNDIDLTVIKEVWDMFPEDKYPLKEIGENMYLKSITEKIDIHLADKPVSDEELDCVDGVIYYRNAYRTLEDKVKLNRDKDKEDINKLCQYINDRLSPPMSISAKHYDEVSKENVESLINNLNLTLIQDSTSGNDKIVFELDSNDFLVFRIMNKDNVTKLVLSYNLATKGYINAPDITAALVGVNDYLKMSPYPSSLRTHLKVILNTITPSTVTQFHKE